MSRNFKVNNYKKKERRKVKVQFIDIFALRRSQIKHTKTFTVYLNVSLSCKEILKRVQKAFGDVY